MPNPTTDDASMDNSLMDQAIQEAGDATETSNNSEVQTDETPQYGQAFQELAEKKGFKSVDDLVNAYKNIEGLSTKTAQEIAELKKLVLKQNEPANPDPYANMTAEQRDALDLIRNIVKEQVMESISPIREEYEIKKAGSVIEGIKKQYPFITDNEVDQAITLMEDNPKLTLDQAVRITSFDNVLQKTATTQKQAIKDQQKRKAFVESGTTARTGDDTDYSKMSLEDLEQILNVPPHAKT